MNELENYEAYCQIFSRGTDEEKERVSLLWFLRGWFIARLNDDISKSEDSSIDEMSSALDFGCKDGLSYIIDQVKESIEHIGRGMHEKILRENVLLPIHKVRQINSYGVNWLSKRNGRTVKEKLSGTKNMMAVNRRMCFDTGENRLYIACIKNILARLRCKMDNLPREFLCESECSFEQHLSKIIGSDLVKEIRHWENLPPNNTLLSDRYYSKVWRAWNDLKKLDDMVKLDDVQLAERLKVFFALEMLHRARGVFSIIQIPVHIDYHNFAIKPLGNIVRGVNQEGKYISFNWSDLSEINIEYNNDVWRLSFYENFVTLNHGGESLKRKISAENIVSVLQEMCVAIWHTDTGEHYTNKRAILGARHIIVDLFGVRPFIKRDGEVPEQVPYRLMRQSFKVYDGDKDCREVDISLDSAQAIYELDECGDIESYSFSSLMHNNDSEKLSKLLNFMGNYLQANSINFLYPDIYNDFQLSMLRKQLRYSYGRVNSLPKSIAALFALEYFNKTFAQDIIAGDCVVVVNLVDNQVTFTLVEGYAEKGDRLEELKKKLPGRANIIWERHPAVAYSAIAGHDTSLTFYEKLHQLLMEHYDQENFIQKHYGVQMLSCESGKLTICGAMRQSLTIDERIKELENGLKIDISHNLDVFFSDKKNFIKKKNVHIVLLSDLLVCSRKYYYFNITELLDGADYYEKISAKINFSLWNDHLPNLAIKRFYGVFPLVENQKIEPMENNVKKIVINKYFTLKKGIKVYHFKLQQDDGENTMQYEAVVKHIAFPLARDVECKLEMTYSYGEDEPYKLVFRPIHSQKSPFREAVVEWQPQSEYPSENLIYPEFPAMRGWDELRKVPKLLKNGTNDVIQWFSDKLSDSLQRYRLIDFSDWNISIKYLGDDNKIAYLYKEQNGVLNVVTILYSKCVDIAEFSKESLRCELYCDLTAENSSTATYEGDLDWFENKNNDMMAVQDILVNGEYKRVFFYPSNFLDSNDIAQHVSVEFVLKERRTGGEYTAFVIASNRLGDVKRYFAKSVCIKKPPVFVNASIMFPAHTIFTNGRNIYYPGCPSELRNVVQKNLRSLLDTYKNSDDACSKQTAYKLLALLSNDIDNQFYDELYSMLNGLTSKSAIDPSIAYALGGCDTSYQIRLLNQIITSKHIKNILEILSIAAWKNEKFIYNADSAVLLLYFDEAIKYLNKALKTEKAVKRSTLLRMEYVLAIFRLRALNDVAINRQLSLNNPELRTLYRNLEVFIAKNKADIKSRIKFEVHPAEQYQGEMIPDFLYAMLVYVTGETGEGDILIQDIAEDEKA